MSLDLYCVPASIMHGSLIAFDGLGRPHSGHVRKMPQPNLNLDVEESSEAYLVSADLPGLGEEDVKIEVHEGVLSIVAEKKIESLTNGADGEPMPVRRPTRSYRRSFRLPEDADEQRISASMDKGVLTLSLAKKTEIAPRRIPVSGSPAPQVKE